MYTIDYSILITIPILISIDERSRCVFLNHFNARLRMYACMHVCMHVCVCVHVCMTMCACVHDYADVLAVVLGSRVNANNTVCV